MANRSTVSKQLKLPRLLVIEERFKFICPICKRVFKKVAQWAFEYNSVDPICCKSCRFTNR